MITPVILLPGVMGTRLRLGHLPWDPDDPAAMLEWRGAELETKRELLSPGHTTGEIDDELGLTARASVWLDPVLQRLAARHGFTDEKELAIARGWAGPAWGFYGRALLGLQRGLNPDLDAGGTTEPFPVFGFGYDWRQSNLTSAAELHEFVDATRRTTSADQVILVTHSMGGLVARAACGVDQHFAPKVAKVIHVGQPADGAPTCYRRFLTGVVADFDDHAPITDPVSWVQEHVLAHIIGTTAREYATLMSELPGPMQLLPNTRFGAQLDQPWLIDTTGTDIGGAAAYDTYRRSDQFGITTSVAGTAIADALFRRLEEAEQFHELIGGVSHPTTVCIYGTGIATDRYTRPGHGHGHLVPRSRTGDGTVDECSANGATFAASSVRGATPVPDVEHSKLLLDDTVLTAIVAAIQLDG